MVDVPAQARPREEAAALRRLAHARPHELATLVDRLSGVVVDEDGLQEVLRRCVRLTRELVAAADATAVTVTAGVRPVTAAATDAWTHGVDEDQYAAGDGPCLEATRSGRVQRAALGEAAGRWPAFAAAAERDGVRSFLAAPLPGAGGTVGALNLYSRAEAAFDDVDEALVATLATRTGDLVDAYLRYADASRLAEQLEEAMRSRAPIEQAKGVLMAVHGVDAETAFALLRQESQRRNVKLRVVAQSVLLRATGSDEADSGT